MPSIDYSGRYHSRARSFDGGAIGLPIKANSDAVAIRFADKMTLELLPGWVVGSVVIQKDGEFIECHTLTRPTE